MALINKLKSIGDAIRRKSGKSEELTLDQMVTEIDSLTVGSGSTHNVLIDSGDFTLSSFGNKVLNLPQFEGEAILVCCADDDTIEAVKSETAVNHGYNIEYVQMTSKHAIESVGLAKLPHTTVIQREYNKTTFSVAYESNKAFGTIANLHAGNYHWELFSYNRTS